MDGALVWSGQVSPLAGYDGLSFGDGHSPAGNGADVDWDYVWIDQPALALNGCPTAVSVAAGGAQSFALDAGAAHQGALYLLLFSASGTAPGLPTDAGVLPLNLDALLLDSLNSANTAVFTDTFGTLDSNGQAAATLNVPAGLSPSLAGTLVVHGAFVAIDPLGPQVSFVSNAVALDFQP